MRRTKCKINKLRLVLILMIIMIISGFSVLIVIEKSIEPKIVNVCEYYCKSQLSQMVNGSVFEVITQNNIQYTDIAVKLINNGKISAVDIKTENVNKIRSAIAQKINEKIVCEAKNEVSIPLGNVSDLFFLSGKGPEISVQFLPESTVTTKIISNMSSTGINQTVHSVSIDITVDTIVILPTENINIKVNSNCILAESIFMGDVPDGIIGNYTEK